MAAQSAAPRLEPTHASGDHTLSTIMFEPANPFADNEALSSSESSSLHSASVLATVVPVAGPSPPVVQVQDPIVRTPRYISEQG